jgi:hypothetical protein
VRKKQYEVQANVELYKKTAVQQEELEMNIGEYCLFPRPCG